MRLFRLPLILGALIAALVAAAVVARVTGLWKFEGTRGRPHQSVP